MTCFDRHACVRDVLKICEKCRFQHHDSNFCHSICICLRKRCDDVNKLQFSKRFRKQIKKIVREFAKIERRDQFIFVRIEKRKKNAIVDLKQWRRNHEYISIIANRAQSTINRVTILTNQFDERLTKTKKQIIDLLNEIEKKKRKKWNWRKEWKNWKKKWKIDEFFDEKKCAIDDKQTKYFLFSFLHWLNTKFSFKKWWFKNEKFRNFFFLRFRSTE